MIWTSWFRANLSLCCISAVNKINFRLLLMFYLLSPILFAVQKIGKEQKHKLLAISGENTSIVHETGTIREPRNQGNRLSSEKRGQ